MSLIYICLLAIALAMDCFTVSIINGVFMRRCMWKTMLQIAFLFGFFQAFMPYLGWECTGHFRTVIESFDHWLAFGLLVFLGGKMIFESFQNTPECAVNPLRLRTQITMAIATSIDALAVGISFSCMGYQTFSQLVLPLIIIGLASFLLSLVGNLLGIRFGRNISKRFKPELLGGLVLILIGCKVLFSHLTI